MTDAHYRETKFGFEYGAADVTRTLSDDRSGVVITISTMIGQVVHVRITPNGRIRLGKVGKRVYRKAKSGPAWVEKGCPIP
jgi:hypothetical protein